MKKVDFVKMGFKNLWRRKLRTILTIMGVVIGTFSIVVMVSLGFGMAEGYKEQMAQWGSLTKITISKNSWIYDENSGRGTTKEQKVDDALIAKLRTTPHVKAVTPIISVTAYLKSGKYQSYLSIQGIEPDTMKYFDFPELESGEYLSNNKPEAILFGADSYHFYNPKQNNYYADEGNSPVDIMNDKVKITFDNIYDSKINPKYNNLLVAGVFKTCTNEFGYSAYAPIETVTKWYKEIQKKNSKTIKAVEYESVWLSVDDVDHVEEVQSAIKDMGYNAYSMADDLGNIRQVSNTLELVLGGIGFVSLLVSAIGIANTMIMSIYERTKEIGVMKVLGCLVTDIRKIFLFEASIIGFCGGTLGVALSYLISYILNKYAPEIGGALGMGDVSTISIIPVWLAIAGVIFAMFIGIVSGLYPAKKATQIKPLEAIRSE